MTDHTENKSFLINLGQKVRMFRQEKNYSQEELADLCGLQLEEVINIENGWTDPWMETMLCISNFLNIPIEKFIG